MRGGLALGADLAALTAILDDVVAPWVREGASGLPDARGRSSDSMGSKTTLL